jgi:hypothetical protein
MTFKLLVAAIAVASTAPKGAPGETFTHPKDGYTVTYPSDWYRHQALIDLGAPLIVSSAPPSAYARGGIIPAGQAEINVQVLPMGETSSDALRSIFDKDAEGRTFWRETFNGVVAEMVSYSFPQAGLPVTRVGAHFVRGGRTFIVLIDYRGEGPVPAQYRAVFDSMILSLVPGEPKRVVP